MALRRLIQCPECSRQFDASKLSPGEKLRCVCGKTLVVEPVDPRDTAVVRCSSCGAGRTAGAASCSFCGNDFTLHERDLHTICPSCMARISDRARYCHHCSNPIRPQDPGVESAGRSCPLCGAEQPLQSRKLGEPPMPLLECPRCAGLWLRSGIFQELLAGARREAATWQAEAPGAPEKGFQEDREGASTGPFYRPCPECGKLMNRRNFGRKSGVVIDICREHGVWFDASELDSILRWVRSGGELRARELEGEEESSVRRGKGPGGEIAIPGFDLAPLPESRIDLPAVLDRLLRWLGGA